MEESLHHDNKGKYFKRWEKGPKSNTFLSYDLFSLVLTWRLSTVCGCEAGNTPFQLERCGGLVQ